MTDLDQVRAWRRAAPNRALVLDGLDGSRGVSLVQFSNGKRNRAQYNSVSAAAVALAAGCVRFKPFADIVPEPPRYGRPLLHKRGRPRKRQ